jgi:hypothetical protein
MSLARRSWITGSWILLLAITIVSVGTAEYVSDRILAVGIVMAITAIKGGLILWNFMDLRSAPKGIGYYLISWVVVCAIMVGALCGAGG